MVFGGDCIAKISGKTVFVPFALPGETLDVEIEAETRDYDRARIVGIQKPSPHRREPFCPLYTVCGGCTLQHADDAYQTELRKTMLTDAFRREGVGIPEVEIVSGSPTAYRARFQLHDGGLMRSRSTAVVSLDSCPCATAEVNRYLENVPQAERPRGRCHVFGSDRISSIPDGYDKIVIAEPRRHTAPERGKGKSAGKKKAPRWAGSSMQDQVPCTVTLCGKPVSFDAQGFFQSNLEVLEKAVPLVTGGLSGESVLDLYAGCGTFSAFLCGSFSRTVMVEHNRDALVYAEQNVAGACHESYGTGCADWVRHHAPAAVSRYGQFDAVTVDPPRSGMEKEVRDWLALSGIPRIRSLSCDAATQARDIRHLTAAGYRLERLFLLDFYPQTAHIESLACLRREPL